LKAAIFHAPGQPLSIETVEDPICAPNEMIVRVERCGICGTDLHASSGGNMEPPAGTIFGHEFSGEIVDIGKDGKGDWRVGDAVVSLPMISCGACQYCVRGNPFFCAEVTRTGMGTGIQGGYAEYVRVGVHETLAVPTGVDWDFAALVEPLAVGLHGIRISRFKAGVSALVIGAGPIGLAVIQWLKVLGARHIIVSELSDERRALAEQMGATATVDAALHPREISRQVTAISGNLPETIFECVGLPNMIQQCIKIAGPLSEIVSLGVCDRADTFTPFLGTMKELTLKFAVAYLKEDFQRTLEMMEKGRLDPTPMITEKIGFDRLGQTFEDLKTAKDQCKVLVSPCC